MKCIYCGEAEATTKIANPNLDMGNDIDWNSDKSWWQVCKDCKEVIHQQQLVDMGTQLGYEKMVNDANNKLDEIAKRTGIPSMNATISKGKNGKIRTSSIEFTGDEK